MKLVLLQFLDSTVETRDSLKHLIVLVFVAVPLLTSFSHLRVLAVHDFLELVDLLLIFI